MNWELDVREVLPSVRVPTLVLHRRGEVVASLDNAHYLARHISGARLVELPGEDHLPWVGDREAVVRSIGDFLASLPVEAEPPDRVLIGPPRVEDYGRKHRTVFQGASHRR